MPFKSIGLSDPLLKGILATGYTAPTEIQSQAIPAAMTGRDIIGCAQTGTGKTAAFVLPILHRLSHEKAPAQRAIRSLILTPTRELAMQIEQSILRYGQFLELRTLAIYGGIDIHKQLHGLRRGVDIVVATPGRLMDHMQRGSIHMNKVEVLVLDEADRMLDMGFINDVRRIIGALPEKRQTLLFSATISDEVKSLASGIQKNPVMIQIGPERNPIDTITQHIYPVEKEYKMPMLLHMLKNTDMYSVLIFSRTKHKADKICQRLKYEGIAAIAIHSDRTQQQRRQALEGFKAGKFQVMVATDIAARGLDIEGITHVINFDVPAFAEDYIHRIGRTGRAAAVGDAITLVSRDEENHLRQIERFIGCTFHARSYESFTYTRPDSPSRKPVGKSHGEKPKPPGRSKSQKHETHASPAGKPQHPSHSRRPSNRRRRAPRR
jgi:ATP-dependent RNA helicase RhlE